MYSPDNSSANTLKPLFICQIIQSYLHVDIDHTREVNMLQNFYQDQTESGFQLKSS